MTIKRQWMLVLCLAAVLAVAVNSIVLGSMINRYFVDYSEKSYQTHLSQIVKLSENALGDRQYSLKQLAMQLESHLSDPITRIRLYDAAGNLLVDVRDGAFQRGRMMGGGMMNRMMGNTFEEVDSADITKDGVVVGKLNIVRYAWAGGSVETRMFKAALIANTLVSFLLILILVIIIGTVVSKKMSRDLRQTAQQAIGIELGSPVEGPKSKVREIRIIQESLDSLNMRLKLRQTGRKKLVDELVHQTRTPLTILKTHLEGFEDGVIQMGPKEIRTCEAQIDNITAIIANMSGMIDAGKEIDQLKIEEFDLSQLLKQIVGGLNLQFEKKNIGLTVRSHQKLTMKTDKYKLSQCVYNILTNAYKFTEPGGQTTLDYRLENETVIIEIADTGGGMGKDELAHLFDAYYRGANAAGTVGDGIGLYIVKENLAKIQGEVRVESEPEKGSLFELKVKRAI